MKLTSPLQQDVIGSPLASGVLQREIQQEGEVNQT